MPYETILTETSESIFTITINRPDKLNALNTAMIRELIDAFNVADADDAVRAIIVTGAGRAFCAGADLSGGGRTFDREARPDRRSRTGRTASRISPTTTRATAAAASHCASSRAASR
jgi:enoyl-CoA hydratase/carnithine racemase